MRSIAPDARTTTREDVTPRPIGGHLALNFSNTVAWRLSDEREERLPDYAALVAWARASEQLEPAYAKRLLQVAARRPRPARKALHRAHALREAIFHIGGSVGRGQPPGKKAMADVHAARLEALGGARLSWVAGRLEVNWDERDANLDRPWWPVAVAAAELLESHDLRRVRMCAGAGCGWLFLDQSRNNSRRWCASNDCGNRARVDRFRARQRRGGKREGRH